ncbi:MAG: hypothetical protein ACYTF6_04010 [Planctomycetota bacterium]
MRRHSARLLQRRYVDLLYQGVPREQIDERITELQAAAAEQATHDLKISLILGRIAEDEEIEVTEDEVNARVAQIASYQNRRPERLRQELDRDGTLEQLRISLREEKVLDKLLQEAKIVEAPQDEKETEADKAAKRPAATRKKAARKKAKKTQKKAKKKKANK